MAYRTLADVANVAKYRNIQPSSNQQEISDIAMMAKQRGISFDEARKIWDARHPPKPAPVPEKKQICTDSPRSLEAVKKFVFYYNKGMSDKAIAHAANSTEGAIQYRRTKVYGLSGGKNKAKVTVEEIMERIGSNERG